MATTFTWSVNTLDRTVETGIVTAVHYSAAATDETNTTRIYGSVGLEAPAEGDTIIPYVDLTETGVLEWTKTALGGDEKVTEMEANLQIQLDAITTPVSDSGIPWS